MFFCALCVLWFFSGFFSREIFVYSPSLNISLSLIFMWQSEKHGVIYGYVWTSGLPLGIFCVKCSSIPLLFNLSQYSADVFTRLNLQITLFSRNPYVDSWKWPKSACEGKGVPRTKMKPSKQSPRHSIVFLCIISAQCFHFWKCLCSHEAIFQTLWQELW